MGLESPGVVVSPTPGRERLHEKGVVYRPGDRPNTYLEEWYGFSESGSRSRKDQVVGWCFGIIFLLGFYFF